MQPNLEALEKQHQAYIDARVNLDLTRGKPSAEQLKLSDALLDTIDADVASGNNSEKTDLRNYGGVSGLKESKTWFANLCGIPKEDAIENIFVGGNSSLSLMHFSLWLAYFLGIKPEDKSWQQEAIEQGEKIKMLCPVPGYDRHFSLCEEIGIEMIPVRLTGEGPDMDQVRGIVKNDPLVKGIWCVPRFSNPTGEVYSEDTVAEIAKLASIAGDNFLVFWDNAYSVHTLSGDASPIADIFAAANTANCENNILQFASTSKITYAGSGIAALASSADNIAAFEKHFGFSSIGPDKINQLRHLLFLPTAEALESHMEKHAELLKPKFDLVDDILEEELGKTGLGIWTKPQGGYFISFDSQRGQAQEIVALAAEAGVKLTPAGSAFPYKNDPENKNIRLAPSFPKIEELKQAMMIFSNCVKLAHARENS